MVFLPHSVSPVSSQIFSCCFPELTTPGVFADEEGSKEDKKDGDDNEGDPRGPWGEARGKRARGLLRHILVPQCVYHRSSSYPRAGELTTLCSYLQVSWKRDSDAHFTDAEAAHQRVEVPFPKWPSYRGGRAVPVILPTSKDLALSHSLQAPPEDRHPPEFSQGWMTRGFARTSYPAGG